MKVYFGICLYVELRREGSDVDVDPDYNRTRRRHHIHVPACSISACVTWMMCPCRAQWRGVE
jgi:hypothetical protein